MIFSQFEEEYIIVHIQKSFYKIVKNEGPEGKFCQKENNGRKKIYLLKRENKKYEKRELKKKTSAKIKWNRVEADTVIRRTKVSNYYFLNKVSIKILNGRFPIKAHTKLSNIRTDFGNFTIWRGGTRKNNHRSICGTSLYINIYTRTHIHQFYNKLWVVWDYCYFSLSQVSVILTAPISPSLFSFRTSKFWHGAHREEAPGWGKWAPEATRANTDDGSGDQRRDYSGGGVSAAGSTGARIRRWNLRSVPFRTCASARAS